MNRSQPQALERSERTLASYRAILFLEAKSATQLGIAASNSRIRLASQIDGGGHERGMRSGTLPVHQIVGLGKAAELALEDLQSGHIGIRCDPTETVRALSLGTVHT